MKYKLIIIIVTLLSCFLIYKTAIKKPINIVALGDGSCMASSINDVKMISYNDMLFDYLNKDYDVVLNDDFCINKLSVSKLINYINTNKKISKRTIQNILDEASYITIMIGYDELTSYKKLNNIITRDYLDAFNVLIRTVKNKSKANIIVIGYYPNYFNNTNYINKRIKQICLNNKVNYVDISDLQGNITYFYSLNSYKLNRKGNEYIFNKIKEKI